MKLLDMKNSVVIISPEAIVIPEFKQLWERDLSENKEKAIKELSFIYFTCDYKSPYLASMGTDRVRIVVSKDFMKDAKYKPDDAVEEAIKKYKGLQFTPSMRLLEASIATIYNLTDYLENVDLQERDKNGKPIYKPTDVTNSLKSIGGIVESLNKVRHQVEREQTAKGSLRGQRQKGNREDPS
tara:strand:+ start:1899 stop:2447 length:549 start_codon:yes stop_codon:yes gene_type:complete